MEIGEYKSFIGAMKGNLQQRDSNNLKNGFIEYFMKTSCW